MPFCSKCGKEILEGGNFCTMCGSNISGVLNDDIPRINKPVEWKDESLTLLLSILLGLFGIQGIGHIYVGQIGKGIAILIGSMILFVIAIVAIMTLIGAIIGVPLLIAYFVIFIWQIFDSRKLCRHYNEYLEKNAKPPW